ncbi:Ff.00g096510.m01.CDS01 [Fusarium sp. VM40]|nr:Ff.00g096510.m01.CDS01 [Fusarium sp. VM40]
MAQPDPSQGVPQDLLPHVHLISSFRYPAMPRLDLNEVAKWLMSAPQVARDRAPFFWTYLDKPTDGTILLTWQPLQRLGTNFATDGYVWAPPEQVYKHDLGNGLMLEIYYQKAGYFPGEQYALHARRRCRLVPIPGHPNPPQPDIGLFVVHYGPAEPNDRVPVSMIPFDERANSIMQQRHFLQRAGQIRRKEFMLSDRVNWPTLPDLTRQPVPPQMAPRGVPQQMAYPTQATPGPPSKRPRHSASQGGQAPAPGMPQIDATFDDEEDVSRGDMFDHLTPREISLSRYQQNHEWMEEILSSPYRISQITPADLNLGFKGELASLTEGIFPAQGVEAFSSPPEKPYIGRLDPEKAEEFRKRVQNHVESTKTEIEKMQAEHAKALAKFKENSILNIKEKELRNVTEGTGSETWRIEGKVDPQDEDSTPQPVSTKTVEEIVSEVESATGKKIEAKPTVSRVQDGGYQPPAPEPIQTGPSQLSRQPSQAGSQTSGIMIGESDIDMGDTVAGLLDEMHTGISTTSTPLHNFGTPQAGLSAVQSGAGTPSNLNAAVNPSGDVTMGGTQGGKDHSATAPDQGTGSGEWVVVPKDSASNEQANQGPGSGAVSVNANTPNASGMDAPKSVAKTASAAATPAAGTPSGSVSFDQNDFSSLGDLDTAGDALASFDGPTLDGSAGELGEGLDLSMDMDDSAFGDAFHGVDTSGTPQGQDM